MQTAEIEFTKTNLVFSIHEHTSGKRVMGIGIGGILLTTRNKAFIVTTTVVDLTEPKQPAS